MKVRKFVAIVTLVCCLCMVEPTMAFAYNGTNAANYARTWYSGYNSQYNNYTNNGGDCTNFASQCAFAGGQAKTNPSKVTIGVTGTTSYWYSYKYIQTNYFLFWQVSSYPVWAESSSWVRVAGGQGFFDYFRYRKTTIVSKDLNYIRSQARLGDIIQVQAKNASAKGHTTVVGAKSATEITLYYHTNNTYRTLASFDSLFGYGAGTNTYTIYRM